MIAISELNKIIHYRNSIIASAAKVLDFFNRFGVGVQRAIAELKKMTIQLQNVSPIYQGKFVVWS